MGKHRHWPHRLAGHPAPDGALVAAVIKGLGRQFGGPQKQGPAAHPHRPGRDPRHCPVLPAHQGRESGDGDGGGAAARRGAMDVAVITVMRDGLLRVSEAAALTWGGIQPQPDGSGLMRIRRSKTDALGEGVLLYLGEEAMQTLGAIRPESAAPDGPVFGLKPAGIAARIRAAAVAAGLGDGFTGHAARVGMAVDLVGDGAELPAVMVAGRWKSPGMVARYAEGTTAGRGAVARYHRNGQRGG